MTFQEQRTPKYSLEDGWGIFAGEWQADGEEPEWQGIFYRDFSSYDRPNGAPLSFNWATRRKPVLLISGDTPRYMLAERLDEPGMLPPIYTLGDVRIRITLGEESFWLDERGTVRAVFSPWGVRHEIRLAELGGVVFHLDSWIARNEGVGLTLEVRGRGADAAPFELDVYYGGLVKTSSLAARYAFFTPDREAGNRIDLAENGAKLSDAEVTSCVAVMCAPAGDLSVAEGAPESVGRRVRMRYTVGAEDVSIRLLASRCDEQGVPRLSLSEFERYRMETLAYYEALQAPYTISTPDPILDAAFETVLMNLDCIWNAPGWLEGVQQWNALWDNNYQIRAAVALGQLDRARETLLFFAEREKGPGPMVQGDGTSAEWGTGFDALPYFLISLYEYWRASGDDETVRRIWERTCERLEYATTFLDTNGNGLLGYPGANNPLLYQFDHLSLPGDASSPTMLLMGGMSRMAEIAEAFGETGAADDWRRRVAQMRSALMRRLWWPDEGRFALCIDPQGVRNRPVVYTDQTFPLLFADCPAAESVTALATMKRELWACDCQMRMANLKPDLFGNSAVQPAQQAEAAEAYAAAGRVDDAYALLHGIAKSTTIYTDSAGAMPEYCSDSGWGAPNYLFGNPIGSFLLAMVEALFGFRRTHQDQRLPWEPSLPAAWERASLRVPGARMEIQGAAVSRTYTLTLDAPQAVKLRVPLEGRQCRRVTDEQGHEIPFRLETHPGGGFVVMDLPVAVSHSVRVEQKARPAIACPPQVSPGEEVALALPSGHMRIHDPQAAFETVQIEGSTLRGRIADGLGWRTVYLTDDESGTSDTLTFRVGEEAAPPSGMPMFQGARDPVDLTPVLNSDSLLVFNMWEHGHEIAIPLPDAPTIDAGALSFSLSAVSPRVSRIEVGHLDGERGRLIRSAFPASCTIAASGCSRGIEMLCACDVRPRLTGHEVADVLITYRDGVTESLPLTYGVELESFGVPWATGVERIRLDRERWLGACTLTTGRDIPLESLTISVRLPDVSLALVAINLIRNSPNNA